MGDKSILLEQQIPALRRYARSLTRDATAADDLVQDCLERALSRWHLRRMDLSVRPWLFTIMHNIFVSDHRRKIRRGPHLPIDELPHAVGTAASQEDTVALRQTLDMLHSLHPDQREVLVLVAIEGFSYREAAKLLRIADGTVMSRLSRARAGLRKLTETRHPTRLREIK